MHEALIEAKKAAEIGEVPVGCVLAINDSIVARAHNQVEKLSDPTAHAEILAMREYCSKIANWRLSNVVLCVTLEPCAMCVGAMRLARVPTVIYGAGDSRFGAAGSVVNLFEHKNLGPVPNVIAGVQADAASDILKDFFKKLRV